MGISPQERRRIVSDREFPGLPDFTRNRQGGLQPPSLVEGIFTPSSKSERSACSAQPRFAVGLAGLGYSICIRGGLGGP